MANQYIAGCKAGLPVAIGYIPIAIAFGLLAKSFDISNYIILLMSLVVFAGASQFIGVNLIVAGVSHWEVVITTFIVNLRHLLMSASLSQRLPQQTPKKFLALLSFGVTDETFSLASTQRERELNPQFVLALNFIAFSSWNIGTWIGVFFAVGLPQSIQASMGIALYSMFIGLLVPSLKQAGPIPYIVFIAITVSSGLHWIAPHFIQLSSGWNIIITTIITAGIGALIFPASEKVGDTNG
ncbi:4-azaleucine resistance transporter AzlC [Desulfitispora alkaliphila]|uniref:AzlC family ABC transporter permease n=1 Tax=Desulfitispora alkaliphila TaxID=622674 RepID=UPI003D203C1F